MSLIRIISLGLIYLLLWNMNIQALLEDLLLKYLKRDKNRENAFYL